MVSMHFFIFIYTDVYIGEESSDSVFSSQHFLSSSINTLLNNSDIMQFSASKFSNLVFETLS